ncbi:MAG: hypothetical protein AAFX99_16025 [Myxococcota bacterium]
MAVNDLIVRARGYVYDRNGWEGFLAELLEGSPEEQHLVAEYLAGHGLMIARFRPQGSKPQSWYWMDIRYRDAMVEVMRLNPGRYEALGWGILDTPEALAQVPLGDVG